MTKPKTEKSKKPVEKASSPDQPKPMLPQGWVETTIGDICDLNPRFTADDLPSDDIDVSFVPMAAVEEESGRLDASETRPAHTLRKGYTPFKENDILFAKITPCMENGKIAVATGLKNGLGYGSTEFFVLRPFPGINPRYILHFLLQQSFRDNAQRQMTGAVGQKRVPKNYLLVHKIPLPPSAEQERIVAKLDAMLSRIAAGESAARRALERLDCYRASVLHAAVTGELTREWRKTHKPEENGEQLLKRLLVERRKRWEENESQRLVSVGKMPKNEKWKDRYTEASGPLANRLHPLPNGWAWASLQQLGFIIGGLTKNPKRANFRLKLPYLRVGNVYANELRLDEMKTIGVQQDELDKLLLEKGDLLIVEGNGSKDQIGRLAVWDGSIEKCVHQNHIIKVRLVEKSLGTWILSWLLSPPGRLHIEKVASSTTGLYTLSVGKIGNLPIPIPSSSEQAIIDRHLYRRLAVADRQSMLLNRQFERARITRQSLLNEAFAGKLVSQSTKEERAQDLIARIRAALEAEANKPKVQRRVHKSLVKRPQPRLRRAAADKNHRASNVISPVAIAGASPRPSWVRLIRLTLYDDFNSLKAASFPLRSIAGKSERLSPLCLVGLNGSGKSNLIEALSEIFCHVELSLLPWESITEKQKIIELRFALEYEILASTSAKPTIVKLEKPDHHPVVFKVITDDKEQIISNPAQCRALLPKRILGYSSGLNETISISYFRTAAIYSQEVLKQAQTEKANPNKILPAVPDSSTFFMDYECNSLILVSNYLLQPRSRLGLFRRNLRIDSLNTFDIRFHGKYKGNKTVELTSELSGYLAAFRSCANSVERVGDSDVFHFNDPKVVAPKLRLAFKTAANLFRALYKLSLLNPLALSGNKRRFHLREDVKTGQLERPPTISREDRIFSVENIRVNLNKPKRAIDYAAISDGEHEFLQIFGSIILFDEPGCVFLLDEPETHFNPHWRRLCIQWLADMKKTQRQELIISTHSPFVVSGCHKKHVFKFVREGCNCVCAPVSDETFGASYDYLLARLFSMETMIAGEAIEAMQKIVKTTSVKKLRQAIPMFGESLEKRFIFERIAQLEQQKKRKPRK